MTQDDGQNPSYDDTAHNAVDYALADLRNALAAMSEHAQLLERRIRQGRLQKASGCLQGLGSIQQAAQVMEAQLRDFDETRESRQGAHDG